MSYANELRQRLPKGMTLPEPFAQTFDWLEAQGWTTSHGLPGDDPFAQQSLLIYPPDFEPAHQASMVSFAYEPGPPVFAPPAEALERITTFATIDGSGGCMSFWLDDAGKQWIVVFNHGYPHVMTDDPLVALQFLAIGYLEPGTLLEPTMTVADCAELDAYLPEEMPIPPEGFRAFLTETFGVTIPERASDLGIRIPEAGASDPIRDYMRRIMPEDAYEEHEGDSVLGFVKAQPFVISAKLREHLSDAQLHALRLNFPFIVEEE